MGSIVGWVDFKEHGESSVGWADFKKYGESPVGWADFKEYGEFPVGWADFKEYGESPLGIWNPEFYLRVEKYSYMKTEPFLYNEYLNLLYVRKLLNIKNVCLLIAVNIFGMN